MRPAKEQQSVLQYPLNSIFGSPAHVRLLRELSNDDTVLSVTDLANKTGLTAAGARRALEKLGNTGILTRVGSGHSQQFKLNSGSTFSNIITQLFNQESQRYEELLEKLKKAFVLPEVDGAWIEKELYHFGGTLYITVLTHAKALSHLPSDLRKRILPIEKEYDLIIELDVHTKADGVRAEEGVHYFVVPVSSETPTERKLAQNHDQADSLSLRAHTAIANMLLRNPSIAKRAKRHIERLLNDNQGTAKGDIVEWKRILANYSTKQLASFLVSKSERATRLRQSSPFTAVLTKEELDKVLKENQGTNEI